MDAKYAQVVEQMRQLSLPEREALLRAVQASIAEENQESEDASVREARAQYGAGDGKTGGPFAKEARSTMRTYTAIIEKCRDTGLYVGYVPGFPGAHTQGETLDELRANLEEVIALLLEDGDPELQAAFVGTQTVSVK